MALNYSRLGGDNATFQKMIQRFGVVTVMNADVYDVPEDISSWKNLQAHDIINSLGAPLCHLDTLKIANATQEGPTKTVTGGQFSNPLIKFGKSARLEIQDALGNARALDALTGTVSEGEGASASGLDYNKVFALHVTEDFNGPKVIVGDSFFIEQKSGEQVKVKIIFYQFLPDSIFNLTQDAEGDATVFDMNGDLLTTVIRIMDKAGNPLEHGTFYSIVDPVLCSSAGGLFSFNATTGVLTLNLATGMSATLDGVATTGETLTSDSSAVLIIKNSSDEEVVHTILVAAKRS